MKKTALIIMVLTIVSRILGFFRDIVLSYYYGASSVSDAYLISMTIPGTIFAFIGAGVATGYIPIYTQIENEKGNLEAEKFTSQLLTIFFFFSIALVLLVNIFPREIVKAFASGFSGETLELAIKLTKIGIFSVFFVGHIYILSSYLQIKNKFSIPAIIGFPLNIIMIGLIYLSSKTDVTLLGLTGVLGYLSQAILLIIFSKKQGYKQKLNKDFLRNPYIKSMAILALPVILGTSINQINTLIDRTLASSIIVGGISALNYANKLIFFVQGIFVISISTVLFPMLSRLTDHDHSSLKQLLKQALGAVSIIIIPIIVGTLIFSNEIITLLFGRGKFDSKSVFLTSQALYFYSFGMLGAGLNELLTKVFYSIKDSKTPTFTLAISVIINIILNLILSKYMGISGLALATSISITICSVMLFYNLRKKIGNLELKTSDSLFS